jgi:Na+-driven multidrug efflux pump
MQRRSTRSIFIFWVPLALTWLMMALEGPFLAAVIARLPDPKYNLAAWGVAFAIAILVEAPVIMIMSASTALVEDAASFRKLRNYTYALNAIITAAMLLVLAPPVFDFIARDLIGLPDEVARLTYWALWLLLPWPAVIGYRRFFQGLLIRDGRTRLVAYGTVVRLTGMATTALLVYVYTDIPGAYLGAAALSVGVSIEAVAARLMVRGTLHRLLATHAEESSEPHQLDYRRITHFYIPLALTSLIGLAVHPMVTFFMGRARFPVESLAVLPVVNSLSFIFRAMGLSYQEVAIALLGKRGEHVKELGRFALGLGLASSAALALIGFTPLARVWYETISGLSHELAVFAITPTRILAPLPALSVLLSFQRAILVQSRNTRPITIATAIEVAGILLVLMALISGTTLVGVTAAAIAFVAGRFGGNAYLVPPCLGKLRG